MKIIQKSNIPYWLTSLQKEYSEIWAPAVNEHGDTLYSLWNNEHSICYDLRPMLSCRRILFPQEETLFEVEGTQAPTPKINTTKRVLFGIRSCDVAGIEFTDIFFRKNFHDVYYLSRRNNALLITIGCNAPLKACWCYALETGPFSKKGFDIQLYDISPEEFLVKPGSPAGEIAIQNAVHLFAEFPDSIAQEKIQELEKTSLGKFDRSIDFPKALKLAKSQSVNPKVYSQYADECLACGACAFVCPTCTCFDVRDIKDNGKVSRCRQWENCFLEGFTKEASGHNPRRMAGDRIARRFEHKLAFEPKNNNIVACTGCGRCTQYCITKIGIHRFAELATKLDS